jgi:signal transduction histidine kinase
MPYDSNGFPSKPSLDALSTELGNKALNELFSRLQPLITEIAKAKTLDDLAKASLTAIQAVIVVEYTGFYFLNPVTKKVELVLAHGLSDQERTKAEETAWNRHPGKVMREMKTYRSSEETSEENLLNSSYTDRLNVESRLYCPILDSGNCLGTLGLASLKRNAFNDNQVALVEFIAAVVGVTHRKILSETLVQDALTRMAQVMNATHSGILLEDEKRRVLHTNQEFRKIFGIPEEAAPHLVGTDCEEGLHQFKALFANEEGFVKRVWDLLANGQKVSGDRLEMKDGRTLVRDYIPINVSGRPAGILWNYHDITEDLAMESQMKKTQLLLEEERLRSLHASKMASLGEMAGGVAHEINTPLAVISTLAGQLSELAQEELQSANPQPISNEFILSHASTIEATSRRIGQIIRGMRTFARDGSQDPEVWIDLAEVLDDTLSLCQESLKAKKITLDIQLPAQVRVRGRPVELSQILLNLISNARDAIDPLNEKWIRIRGEKVQTEADAQAFLLLHVQDSGQGIPPEVRNKLFQPFFTTKPVGKGTGLGLGISKKLAEAQGGSLELDSNSAHTDFVLKLKCL